MQRIFLATVQALAIAVLLATPPVGAMADTYPSKPIRLIVPTAPGGGYDFVARVISDKLALEMGQPIVVENRTGSGTVVGTQVAASALADGYTLITGGLANLAFNPGLYENLPYKTSDFTPIGLIGSFSYTLVARKDLAQTSLRQIIEYARANPGKLNIATAGVGTGQQIAAALLKSIANIDLLEIPYKGAQPAYSDLFGGRVDLFFDNTSTAKPLIDTARVKPIVTATATRDALVPQVPTAKEAGLDGLVLEAWIGIFAPAKTPPADLEKLRSALKAVTQSPELRKRLDAYGLRPFTMTPTETTQFLEAEYQKWPAFLRQAGIKAE